MVIACKPKRSEVGSSIVSSEYLPASNRISLRSSFVKSGTRSSPASSAARVDLPLAGMPEIRINAGRASVAFCAIVASRGLGAELVGQLLGVPLVSPCPRCRHCRKSTRQSSKPGPQVCTKYLLRGLEMTLSQVQISQAPSRSNNCKARTTRDEPAADQRFCSETGWSSDGGLADSANWHLPCRL